MSRFAAVFVMTSWIGVAPFQCASESDPSQAIEETPGQALYELAGEFKKSGDMDAWRDTLQYIVARYPASRFAEAARVDLEQAPAANERPAPHTAATPP